MEVLREQALDPRVLDLVERRREVRVVGGHDVLDRLVRVLHPTLVRSALRDRSRDRRPDGAPKDPPDHTRRTRLRGDGADNPPVREDEVVHLRQT